MTEALEKAYASNTETPLHTLRIKHSAISGGSLDLVQGYFDITATLEDSTSVTFTATGFNMRLPARTTDGRQDLNIDIDNTNNNAWTQISAVKAATRVTQEKAIIEYRPFLESDLSAPAGNTYKLTARETVVNRNSATISAIYTPITDIVYPPKRYYPAIYPGVRYV